MAVRSRASCMVMVQVISFSHLSAQFVAMLRALDSPRSRTHLPPASKRVNKLSKL